MNKISTGVLEDSKIYFSSPSIKAKNLYYYVLSAGHFYCNENYSLERDNYESVLVVHVVKGSFTFKTKDGNVQTAYENDTVILDCYEKHEYCTKDYLEFIWVHVAGVNSREICNEIIKNNGNVLKNSKDVKKRIVRLYEGITPNVMLSETRLSLEIYKLFASLLSPDRIDSDESINDDNIKQVRDYIINNLSEQMSVEKLSELAHLSSTHFSRLFKLETGFSPYNYILNVRLNRAKELLLKSDKSITEIAYETGFNSEANFIYCFKKSEGLSPGKFRKIKF